jgi:hypothetical protein
MHFAGSARHTLASAAAVLAVLVFAGVTLASRIGVASATGAGVADQLPAPSSTSTSSTTSSTPTSTSTSTTVKPTSTTVKPRPTTTKPPPPPTALRTTPPAPVVTQPPSTALPAGTSPAERCTAARQLLAQRGLVLPAGWGFRCPGAAIMDGVPRWGMACWNCEGNNISWIAIDIGRIGASEATLRHVIAHEICHAKEYVTLGLSTELTADLCAAGHGAPRP